MAKSVVAAAVAFGLVLAGGAAKAQITTQAAADGSVALQTRGKPVLTYRARPDDPAKPWIANSIHPLFAPDGTLLTVDNPTDHLFHRGLWWSWRRILENGQVVADSWVMRDIVFDVTATEHKTLPDGAAEIRAHVLWKRPSTSETLFEETTVIRVRDTGQVRRVEIDTDLVAKKPGLAIAGSDDVKGYGGLSIRLPRHEALIFSSNGKLIEARHPDYPTGDIPMITAGDTLSMTWPMTDGMPAWKVDLQAWGDGAPVNTWILRNSPSMQNAAWPGREAKAVPPDKPLKLRGVVTISPRG